MKGKEAIVARILEDARREASQIVEEAQAKAQEVKSRQQARADEMQEAFGENIEARAAEIKHRRISVGKLDMRKKMLAAKQGLIDKAFAQALASVGKMPDTEYKALIAQLVLASAGDADEEIVFGKDDPHKPDKAFVGELNKKLSGRAGRLTLGAPSPDFTGGFILRRGGRETNCTMDAVLKSLRERIEPEVASLLFEEK